MGTRSHFLATLFKANVYGSTKIGPSTEISKWTPRNLPNFWRFGNLGNTAHKFITHSQGDTTQPTNHFYSYKIFISSTIVYRVHNIFSLFVCVGVVDAQQKPCTVCCVQLSGIIPVQLTTCRIGNLTRLIHTLAKCVTIQYNQLTGG